MNELNILYVEENAVLHKKVGDLLVKFFHDVDLVENVREGVELFKKKHYAIVLIDTNILDIDGMQFCAHIHKNHPETKVIAISEPDNIELLIQCIEMGIFRFLKKPLNITALSKVLKAAITEIQHEHHTKVLQTYIDTTFKQQSIMVALLKEEKIVVANHAFLQFFSCEAPHECEENVTAVSKQFIRTPGFLYNKEINAIEVLKKNPQKLYNIKVYKNRGKIHHCLIKYEMFSNKHTYGALFVHDVTELNLLEFLDKNDEEDSSLEQDTLFDSLDLLVHKNNPTVELHNYYKGLSITNKGIIERVDNNSLVIKTNYIQQKAMQIENKTLIISPDLPYTIEAANVKKIDYIKQLVVVDALRFVKTSPITRKSVRVIPSGKQSVTLLLENGEYKGDVSIEDISIDAVKLCLSSLPAGIHKGKEVALKIELEFNERPLLIHAAATFYRMQESESSFSLVFMFKDLKKSTLTDYIAKRQMELIREIKGVANS